MKGKRAAARCISETDPVPGAKKPCGYAIAVLGQEQGRSRIRERVGTRSERVLLVLCQWEFGDGARGRDAEDDSVGSYLRLPSVEQQNALALVCLRLSVCR